MPQLQTSLSVSFVVFNSAVVAAASTVSGCSETIIGAISTVCSSELVSTSGSASGKSLKMGCTATFATSSTSLNSIESSGGGDEI
ncbi:unnamed protein product [Acanthoscelides obtectus]|uniref:Secreted protein n=1 Tax=Acanthoscelides obtectus TaxID=200917 RepID=A0A9P0Q6Y6_ACAOB|nr:unnamed protein product [Acanthoscelides obtectus]CAK1673025.1 hypothetical protein AOBTE_LOCUS29206 [Acanthoscelides obtectus]